MEYRFLIFCDDDLMPVASHLVTIVAHDVRLIRGDPRQSVEAQFKEHVPDLIFLDLDATSFVAGSIIKDSPKHAVVVASTKHNGPHVREAYELGARSVRKRSDGTKSSQERVMLLTFKYWIQESWLPSRQRSSTSGVLTPPQGFESSNPDDWP